MWFHSESLEVVCITELFEISRDGTNVDTFVYGSWSTAIHTSFTLWERGDGAPRNDLQRAFWAVGVEGADEGANVASSPCQKVIDWQKNVLHRGR